MELFSQIVLIHNLCQYTQQILMQNNNVQSNNNDSSLQTIQKTMQLPKQQKDQSKNQEQIGSAHQMQQLEFEDYQQTLHKQYFKQFFAQGDQKYPIELQDNIQINQHTIKIPQKIDKNQPLKQGVLIKKQSLFSKLMQVKQKNMEKYQAIINLLQFLHLVKSKIKVSNFYFYSAQVFQAIKNSYADDLTLFLHTLKKMHNQIFKLAISQKQQAKVIRKPTNETFSTNNTIAKGGQKIQNQQQLKNKQFLLILRFLTSQDRIVQFIKSQQIQQNYQFLIQNMCLGHYNNQANKRAPEKQQIELLKELLQFKGGKNIFQKICAINHANKIRRCDAKAYQLLYKMDLNALTQIHSKVKKRALLYEITQMIYEKSTKIQTRERISQQGQKQEEFDQFLQNQNKSQKKISVRHLGSLQLPEKFPSQSFNIKKASSIEVDEHKLNLEESSIKKD